MIKFIGTDCDGFELDEYMILRPPFYSDIDFNKDKDVEPRQYCVIKGSDGEFYLINVYDSDNEKAIRRYEGIREDEPIPVKVKKIEDSIHYEIAIDSFGHIMYYESDKKELHEKLQNVLGINSEIKLDKINHQIQKMALSGEISPKDISDGHHTFKELYQHRTALFCTICNLCPDISWKSKKHFDEDNDPMYKDCFIVGINTPKGIVTYHIKLEYWDLFNIPIIPNAPKYDGYSSQDVVERILSIEDSKKEKRRIKKQNNQ